MTYKPRHSTGIDRLDEMLGGGLIPGTLTVVLGATGIGKTHLGVHYAQTGADMDDKPGVFFDVSSRGDSQNHAGYAHRMFNWDLGEVRPNAGARFDAIFDREHSWGDYLHIFDYSGRRVTRSDLEWEAWHEWQADVNARLGHAISFLYGNFIRGCRRVVVDGVEPVDRPHESIQMNLFEYVYHQVIRKDPEWVARDLLRQAYRSHADTVSRSLYEPASIGCLMLCTSHETMLDDLIERPLDEGDLLSNANTVIFLGKIRDGLQMRRGLYVAKHRGSACEDRIATYTIDERGISIDG
jgi:KaiC/GvpD/RAD55 family RecA-like ATPase